MKKKNVSFKKLGLQKKVISNLDNLKGGKWGTQTCGTTCLPANGTVNPYDVGETIRLLSDGNDMVNCNYSNECSDLCASRVYYATCAYGDETGTVIPYRG